MTRIIGILTGCALAVAILIVALGVPELEAPKSEPAAPTAAVTQPDAAAQLQPAPLPQVVSQPDAEPAVDETPDVPPEPVVIAEATPTPIEEQWYAFWSPFRSKVAADGFVSQLQKTTGLDYRVVKLGPGVYEVAFAYSDDSDIEEKLVQISSATGLDLSGG